MKRKIIPFFSILLIVLEVMSQFEIPLPPEPNINPESDKEKQNSANISNNKMSEQSIKVKKEPPKIIFRNKDLLSGTLISANKETIEWKSENSVSPVRFFLNAVEKIDLPLFEIEKEGETHSVILINGDIISGKIISLDKENLSLQTAYVGKLDIPKKYLTSIFSSKKEGIIYRGPKEGDTVWVKVQNASSQFRIVNDVMIIPRNSAAAIEIPKQDLFKFSFEAPVSAMINIGLFANTPVMYNAGGYMIGINNNYVYVQSMSKRGGGRNLGNAQIEDLPDKAYIKYTILANRQSSSFIFMVEDQIIQRVSDSSNKNNENGKFFVISYSHGALREIKIKNILISEWDGLEDNNVELNDKISNDIIFFTNKDKASGKLEEIKNNEFYFKTDFALLKIPEDRVAKIKFASTDSAEKSLEGSSLIAKFGDQDRITLSLTSIENGLLTAENPIFGKAKFNLSFCSSLLFNNKISDKLEDTGNSEKDVDVEINHRKQIEIE